ncbi:hypothetical protein KGF56_000146 [Candida oxycetoniae]|uniref:Nudix hydrolase domain-containing protein n=1 Tax=Candida oxycetoniae TaxID=497107 RepID=A0AAI9X0A5_9ASCO|nr:uncharacterized protein KGF56_000146 [Candida oxycetoniae]KAI3407058.2 hypothetical protein KGF56_000146 [Candida oxycetoniae]
MTIAVSYTLGFVRCKENNKVLLLNREKAPWMGKWNGIGGKIEPNETSMESMRREAIEETGLDLPNFKSRGILTWEIHVTKDKPRVFKDTNENKTHMPITEGLYLFTADITIEQYENYNTPIIYNDEGILDWKDIAWITHEYNYGIVDNVRFIFKYLFQANENDLFTVKYNDTELVNAEYLQGKNPLSCEK